MAGRLAQGVSARVLVVAFTSDWLYTPTQNKLIVESLHRLGKEASYLEIDHKHGHDSFLIKSRAFLRSVRVFLKGVDEEEKEVQNADRFRKVENRYEVKKEADFKVIDNWVQPGESVWIWDADAASCSNTSVIPSRFEDWGWIMIEQGHLFHARGVAVYQEDIRRRLKIWGINPLIGSYSHA